MAKMSDMPPGLNYSQAELITIIDRAVDRRKSGYDQNC